MGEGKNLIPTIHVRDLARCVKRVTDPDVKCNKNYIFAVDKTKKPNQKRLIKAVSRGVGTGKYQEIDVNTVPETMYWREFMLINLKMRSSSIFKKLPVPQDDEGNEKELNEEEEKLLGFEWHCREGIWGTAKQLNEEFNVARNLIPVKIMVTGPPASGKSYYSDQITKNYDIPHITIK
jgi:adenylate kinase